MISHLTFKSSENYVSLLKIPMNILIEMYKEISKLYIEDINYHLMPYTKDKKSNKRL